METVEYLRGCIAALESIESACLDAGETGLYLLDPHFIDKPLGDYREALQAAEPAKPGPGWELVKDLEKRFEEIRSLRYERPKRVNGGRWGIRTDDQNLAIRCAVNALAVIADAKKEGGV